MARTSDISRGQLNDLRAHALLMIGLLVIQYTLGMLTNLFVQFPDASQPSQAWAVARSQFPAVSHIVIGLLLMVSAIVFVVRATGQGNGRWLVSAVVGLIAIIVAIYGGVTYVSTQADTYSLVMALAFIAALLAYSGGLYGGRRQA